MQSAYSPTDTDNEVNLGLCGDVEVTSSTGSPLQANLLLLLLQVLLNILLSPLEDNHTLGPGSLREKSMLVSASKTSY